MTRWNPCPTFVRPVLSLILLMTVGLGITRAQERREMTKTDVEKLIVELSNWGRWGKDDQNQVSDAPTSGDFVQISSGSYHSCAIDTTGRAHCWGT